MSNTTTVVEEGNAGDHDYVVADIDITSLGAAGTESFDPAGSFGLQNVTGGEVLQQENGGYHATVAQNNDITVKYADYDASSDGVLIDVPSATDVGVVRVKFYGNHSA
jgi:hypothetical protein